MSHCYKWNSIRNWESLYSLCTYLYSKRFIIECTKHRLEEIYTDSVDECIKICGAYIRLKMQSILKYQPFLRYCFASRLLLEPKCMFCSFMFKNTLWKSRIQILVFQNLTINSFRFQHRKFTLLEQKKIRVQRTSKWNKIYIWVWASKNVLISLLTWLFHLM